MAKSMSGKTSGVNTIINNFANEAKKMFDDFNETDKIDKTLELTAKTKGVKAATEEIAKLNKEISSTKKILKDSDITVDMYAKSDKLNAAIEKNLKTVEKLSTKASQQDALGKGLGKNDTEKFYEAYYVLEEHLNKIGKEMPDKFQKAFKDIQKSSELVFEGSAQQIDKYYDISLSEIKNRAIRRANRDMSFVVSDIKAQYKSEAEAKIAELNSQKEKLLLSSSSSSSVNNLKELNKLGFTDDGDIDRSRLIFKNFEQCNNVISAIRENLSKISSEDSKDNVETIESANILLSELEDRLIRINEVKTFKNITSNIKNNVEDLWNSGELDEDYKIKADDQLRNLQELVDNGGISAEQAGEDYKKFCDELVELNNRSRETASSLEKLNQIVKQGYNSNGEFSTWKKMFEQGDKNEKTIKELEQLVNLLSSNVSLLDDDELDNLFKAENLLAELRDIRNGVTSYRSNYDDLDDFWDDDVIDTEERSTSSGHREADTFEEIEESAEDAADAKQKFVEANKEVFDSIVNTLKWLGDEDEGFRKLAENLGTALGQFGDFASSSNFSNFIEALDKIIEKIGEVTEATKNSAVTLNLKEDYSMENAQKERAVEAYYADAEKRYKTAYDRLNKPDANLIQLMFGDTKNSSLNRDFRGVLSTAEEYFSPTAFTDLPNDKERVKRYTLFFQYVREFISNTKEEISNLQQALGRSKPLDEVTINNVKDRIDAITELLNNMPEDEDEIIKFGNGEKPKSSKSIDNISKERQKEIQKLLGISNLNDISRDVLTTQQRDLNRKLGLSQQLADILNLDWLVNTKRLPSESMDTINKHVNDLYGVTTRGRQSAKDKKEKAKNSTIKDTLSDLLGISDSDSEKSKQNIDEINQSLLTLSQTLEEIKGILLSISQKNIFNELFGDEDGRLNSISEKISEIIQRVRELNQLSEGDTKSVLSEEGKTDIKSYADSIKEGESEVSKNVTDVMEAGIESGMEALDEHSPSVIYRIMGQNSMEGYILGIKDKEFELIDTVGKVLKSGFLNNDADAKWLNDFWKGLISKDNYSIEKIDLLPDYDQFATEAFKADIKGQVVEGNNLVDILKSTALATRDVAKANKERAQSERELSTEVEKKYESEFVEEGKRSRRNMKKTMVTDGLREYEEEISPGRKRRYRERWDDESNSWVRDREIISTDYDKLVNEAVDATVRLTKAQHNLEIEQAKQKPNIDLIIEYNNQIREAQERLDKATLSAANFAQETVNVVNTDDPRYDTKYVMGMFNDAVNEQSAFKLSDENIRFFSKLRNENESTQKSINATTKALAGLEAQVRTTEYSYDQKLAPGLTKPVTKQSDLDELSAKRDEILNRINSLKGTSATVQDIVDIRKLISEYQLLAKAKRDANNVVDKNLGGDTLEVKVSKQITNIDKLISKSEQYGDETEDITNKLKEQKKVLEDTLNVNQGTGNISTSIEAKDFYDIQSNVKILGYQLDSNIVKIKEQKELVNEYLKAFAQQQKSLNNIQVLQEKGESQNKNAISAETQKMKSAANDLKNAEDGLKKLGFDFSSIQQAKDNIVAEKGAISGKYYDNVNILANNALNRNSANIDDILKNGNKFTNSFITKVGDLKSELQSLMAQELDFNDDNAKKKLDDIKLKVEEIKTEAKSDDVQLALDNTIEKTKLKIAKFISDNSAMSDEYRSKLQNLEIRLDGAELTKSQVNDIVNSFINLETEITKAGQTGKSFIATIKNRLTGLNAQLIAQYLSFQDLIRYGRTAVTTIIQLDTALVDLRKTTLMNTQELNEFYRVSTDIGKQLGVTSQQIIQQAADWSRLGYSTKEQAETMAELSSKFASVSPGMSTEQSTDYLVSTMKAFGIETDEVERKIMDNVNRIGNTFATTNAEIGEMLTRSSAAMHEANNSLEETIALESAAVQITRNAETTGTAFRTVSMRIRGMDEETEELSADLENIAGDLADLTKINGKGGIRIFTDDTRTEYKSTYQILKELADIWDELTDKQHADILEKIAGKRGGQVIAGLLNNFDEVERALEEMKGAAGSAEAEMDIVRSSLDFKINALKQTWVGVLQDLIDRGTIGTLIDSLTKVSEALGWILDKLGLVKTAIAGIAGVWGAKNLG